MQINCRLNNKLWQWQQKLLMWLEWQIVHNSMVKALSATEVGLFFAVSYAKIRYCSIIDWWQRISFCLVATVRCSYEGLWPKTAAIGVEQLYLNTIAFQEVRGFSRLCRAPSDKMTSLVPGKVIRLRERSMAHARAAIICRLTSTLSRVNGFKLRDTTRYLFIYLFRCRLFSHTQSGRHVI